MSENNNSLVDSLVVIRNGNFEETVLADGEFTFTPPPGWEEYDPKNLVPANPTIETSNIDTFNPLKSNYPSGAAQGQNVGDVNIVQPPGSGIAGLSQTLDTVLQPNTRYTLTVDVGNPVGKEGGIDLTGFPGYALALSVDDCLPKR